MASESLHPDQLDMLVALLEAQAEFLVVGGFAFAAHAYIRATKDIDFWVRPTIDNAQRVWRALLAFKAPVHAHGLTLEDLATGNLLYQVGLPPARVDLITTVADLDFEACWRRRTRVSVGDLEVPVLGLDDLIHAKRVGDRKQDRLDVGVLLEVKQRHQGKSAP
ncbi:MAG: hypothetical protein ACOC1G_00965 [Phycisphaeraceae bacterium]